MGKNILLSALVLSVAICTSLSWIGPNNGRNGVERTNTSGSGEPFVVFELFTSQGCSSCPPADALLKKVKEEHVDNTYTLSYHVDYWNYIGWEDPFGKPEFAVKQRKYNNKFKNRSNYTPQLVVNGREHFVGSNSKQLLAAITKYKSVPAGNTIKLDIVEQDNDNIYFTYELEGETREKHLRSVLLLDNRITEVKRGENRSRTLSNDNIVVAEKSFDLKEPTGIASLEIPDIVETGEKVHLMVLVEKGDHDISGAAKIELVN